MVFPVDILLVEDNRYDLDLALHSLEQYLLAHAIRTCRDGEEAVEFMASSAGRNIGLVLLDLHLPGLSGFEVLAAIRANPQSRTTPVIVLTSSDNVPDIERSRELGADHYMVKPIDFTKVVQVAKLLGFRWALMAKEPASAA